MAQSSGTVHTAGQTGVTPSHRYGVQDGLPDEPSGEIVQVPSDPAWLQESQLLEQVLSQQ